MVELVQPAFTLDAAVQASFVPRAPHGGVLLVWRRDGKAPAAVASEVELSVAGESRRVRALSFDAASLPLLFDPHGQARQVSAAWSAWADLARFARGLLARGSLRPTFAGANGAIEARWRAQPDADERRLLVSLARRLPPSALASPEASPPPVWSVARAFVDAFLDALMRRALPPPPPAGLVWEGEVEQLLSGSPPHGAFGLRSRRSLEQWESTQRAREAPRGRLVVELVAPDEGPGHEFLLRYAFEARDPLSAGMTRLAGPVPAHALWSDAIEAHAVADDLEPARRQLQEALTRLAQQFAPVELSLAAPSPDHARLTAQEAWDLLTREPSTFEALGVRFARDPALDGVEQRFPRARVVLLRDDGLPADDVSLASRYRVRWEVVGAGEVLGPAELREAGRWAPLARVRGLWLPMTREAGERLAQVAERPEMTWTGPQALAAALAGEVRQAGDLSDAEVVPEPGLRELVRELGREAEDVPLPTGLNAKLRDYQRRGLAWLWHRTRLGLGALLADDMGLGKTVQLIALLLLLKERAVGSGPTLVVCPASLVGNWERELSRFAPSLRVLRHHGADRFRSAEEVLRAAGPHDVVITTYGLARRDAAMLGEVPWGTLVADEAQNVKNPHAAQSRALRSIGARRRVALSGTPVENRLSELWALLELLNPGLLGPLERFRRDIALPLERERDARALRWLRAATSPFLLRRLKTDPQIAPELPEKEVIRVFCSLTEEQARLYAEAVERSLAAIDDASGMERRGRVLKLLTELKQVCNHPAHFLGEDGPLPGRSGKLERAAEMLEEIVDSGERALVFTQYVEMGDKLAAHLARRIGSPVPFFHGGLSLPQRDEMVRSFQQDSGGPPVMVLSLRAGGVGLNLTRASHVLHYDRWWNPAVEDQATDRAHRIGQTRRVQVHHLVSLGTLEERIDRLLEEKRGLADAVVSGGEAWLTELSTDELRALVSLGSDAVVEGVESFSQG